jgi:signal peptidase I
MPVNITELQLNALSQDVLRDGVDIEIMVKGQSMFPMIREGDKVRLGKINHKKDFNIGRIVMFMKDNTFIAHRIVRRYKIENKQYIITKGDNNIFFDEPVLLSSVIGIIKEIKRNNKVIYFFDNKFDKMRDKFYAYCSSYCSYLFVKMNRLLIKSLKRN